MGLGLCPILGWEWTCLGVMLQVVRGRGGELYLCPFWMGIWSLYPLDFLPFVLEVGADWEGELMDELE